jgi:hypothetical protein
LRHERRVAALTPAPTREAPAYAAKSAEESRMKLAVGYTGVDFQKSLPDVTLARRHAKSREFLRFFSESLSRGKISYEDRTLAA